MLRHRRPLTFAIIVASTFLTPAIAACTPPQDCGGFVKTTGTEPDVVVLVRPPSNSAATGAKIAASIAREFPASIAQNDTFSVLGLIYPDKASKADAISCMGPGIQTYSLASKNSKVDKERPKLVASMLEKSIATSVTESRPQALGDPRILFNSASGYVSSMRGVRVILWATFQSNGTDCMNVDPRWTLDSDLARRIVKLCATQGTIGNLTGAKVTVIGAGTAENKQGSSAFARELARGLCIEAVGPTGSCTVR